MTIQGLKTNFFCIEKIFHLKYINSGILRVLSTTKVNPDIPSLNILKTLEFLILGYDFLFKIFD